MSHADPKMSLEEELPAERRPSRPTPRHDGKYFLVIRHAQKDKYAASALRSDRPELARLLSSISEDEEVIIGYDHWQIVDIERRVILERESAT